MISANISRRSDVVVKNHRFYFYSVIEDDGRIEYFDYFGRPHWAKVYYRPERTWDDHMGNTPCGYYVNILGERVYLYS